MSAGLQPLARRTQDQIVLGDLLHSLSQPLTSLRCSLELSIEEVAGPQHGVVSAALEQTDHAIGMVRLMREYLETEPATPPEQLVSLGGVLRSVINQLSSGGQVQLEVTEASSGTIALAEPRLRLALQYLVGVLIEEQPPDCGMRLRLEQGPSESKLCAQVARNASTAAPAIGSSVTANLRAVKLAIARRVLESAGASLAFDCGDQSGFVLRFPLLRGPSLLDLST